MKKISTQLFFLVALLIFFVCTTSSASAAYERVAPGATITIGEFVYDDDYVATTTPCTVSIYDTTGTLMVNAAATTNGANGWHYYNYAVGGSETPGSWPAFISCGSVPGGDLIKQDKTFVVGNVIESSSTIATAVWNQPTRTLTDYATSSIASAAASSVWSSGARTLTSFGNLVADVWGYGSRSLTDFGTLVTDTTSSVWSATTRTLTGAGLTSGSLATQSDIASATSSVITEVNNNTNSVVLSASTTLGARIAALNNITADDVWAAGTRTLTGASLSSGYLATLSDVSAVKTKTDTIDWTDVDSIVTTAGTIQAKTDTINWANVSDIKTKTDNIAWADVTGIKTKTDTIVWGNISTLLSEVGTGNISAIKTKTDTIDWTDVDGIVTATGAIQLKTDTIDWSNVTAIKTKTDTILWTDVTGIKTKTDTINWTNVSDIKTKTDTINWSDITGLPASVATAVWNAGTRTLTGFETLVADIWSSPTRRLSDATLSSGTLATTVEINTAVSALNNISAADVWAAGTRTLTDNATSSIAQASANAVWNLASSQLTNTGTVGKLLVDNLDAQVSSLTASSSITAADVWNYSLRSLTDYATSSVAQAASAAVWTNATRSLTNYGNDITAQNVWDVLASSLTSVNSIGKILADNVNATVGSRASETGQLAGFRVTMSDYSSVQAGSTYRARIQVLNGQSVPVDAASTPLVTLYDASRNVVASAVPMTDVGVGLYEYTYSVSSSASQGVWEALVSTEVESGKTITTNDYWIVAGSPAQVIINSVDVTGAPNISANLTITNEGLAGYEYQYEWCVVSGQTNACGGGDDVYNGTGAKYINPGEDFNTNLTATVPNAGSYYFKVIVYFGTESSGSSRSFTIASGGGGGGGGGGGSSSPKATLCKGADFNGDNKVNSIDFSILLAFWKTASPFTNKCVDTNKDSKVDSIDFSILLSQWGTSGTNINIKK